MRIMSEIYFACSIRGGGDTSRYRTIVDSIKTAGGNVLSEVFVNDAIQYGGSPLPSDEIYRRDIQMIHDSDAMVAEVSNPSLGVGYELAYAEKLGRPILCLIDLGSENRLSAMVSGNEYNSIGGYDSDDDILNLIKTFFSKHSLGNQE